MKSSTCPGSRVAHLLSLLPRSTCQPYVACLTLQTEGKCLFGLLCHTEACRMAGNTGDDRVLSESQPGSITEHGLERDGQRD